LFVLALGRQEIQIISAERFVPALLRARAVDGFAGSDPVRPRAHPSRVTERWELPGDYPQRFLKNVLRGIGIRDDRIDVLVKLRLKRAQQTVERLSVAGLCAPDEEKLVSAFRQRALIDSRAISTRPTEREM